MCTIGTLTEPFIRYLTFLDDLSVAKVTPISGFDDSTMYYVCT